MRAGAGGLVRLLPEECLNWSYLLSCLPVSGCQGRRTCLGVPRYFAGLSRAADRDGVDGGGVSVRVAVVPVPEKLIRNL